MQGPALLLPAFFFLFSLSESTHEDDNTYKEVLRWEKLFMDSTYQIKTS